MIGTGERGHDERGLFARGISRVSQISQFSRILRRWSDPPYCSTLCGLSLESLPKVSKFNGHF